MKPILLSSSRNNTIKVADFEFKIYKFNSRHKPLDNRRIVIIGCFSEFGCETLGIQYCLPRFIRHHPGSYFIGIGWYGREYLYRGIIDEFWEIEEKGMYLRNNVNAFRHFSDELDKIEEDCKKYGNVIKSDILGAFIVGNRCNSCGFFWTGVENKEKCSKCGSTYISGSTFSDIKTFRKDAYKIPLPNKETLDWADSIVSPNMVGVFARNRKMYGRNLPIEFYKNLINLLENKNYSVIWLGEKQSVYECPNKDILDFSRMEESRDLEKTLAIISKLKFTTQFWTASSRLSGLVGTPFLIVESPDQIYHIPNNINFIGQEGLRLELTSYGPKKIVICDFDSVCDNKIRAIDIIDKCIVDMENNNYKDVIGLVKDYENVEKSQKLYYNLIGENYG